ncbi:MAG: VanW family protein [Pyrinomonadaceae bacterium]
MQPLPPTNAPSDPNELPTRAQAMLFAAKAKLLQARRSVRDLFDPDIARHPNAADRAFGPVIATSKTPLWSETAESERYLVAGKIENLRLALRRLDGVVVPAGKIFSFWKQIGRASRRRGFVAGRELREGCVIPSVGGGLCQLSNALYDAALQAGFEIVERHAHSRVIPGSLAERRRDATVFWNYIDLRFRSDRAFLIEAELDSNDLTVRFRGETPSRETVTERASSIGRQAAPLGVQSLNSCASCGQMECHRAVAPGKYSNFGRTAYLVDEFWPEFDRYVQAERTDRDILLVPLDGSRYGRPNYAWSSSAFGSVRQSVFVTIERSYRSRRLAAQGAARQQNLLRMHERLADDLARKLGHDVLHVVVQQNLLPFLWKKGHLGGRTFDVLMTAAPMAELQRNLDRARSLHPTSTTLGDFRASDDIVTAESQALANARRIITPHVQIADMFPRRARLIEWHMPETSRPIHSVRNAGTEKRVRPNVVFPAATVGRKGCYELREALRGSDVRVVLLGPLIESPDFWSGFDTSRGGEDWLETADVVVLPAFVEHRPRRLLAALCAGVPVIATHECGISAEAANLEVVRSGDPNALREAVERAVSDRARSALG